MEPVELVLLLKAIVETARAVYDLRHSRGTPSDKA